MSTECIIESMPADLGHIVHPSPRKRDPPIECAPSFESCKRSWIHRGCLASNALDFGEKRPQTERLITLKIWRMSEIWDLFGTGVWEDNAVAVAQFLSLCQLLSFWLVNLCQPLSFWIVGCYSWQIFLAWERTVACHFVYMLSQTVGIIAQSAVSQVKHFR